MDQACQLQCLSVVTMETDALPANRGCLRDVFSDVALPICSCFLIFLEERKRVVWSRFKVWFCLISSVCPKGWILRAKRAFLSHWKNTLYSEKERLCATCQIWGTLADSRSRRLSIAWFFFQRKFFLTQQVVRRMWSNFIDLIKSGWFILPISWHPASTSITLATLETDWNIMALPVKRNKLSPVKVRFSRDSHKYLSNAQMQVLLHIFQKPLSTFLWDLHPSHRINSVVLGS